MELFSHGNFFNFFKDFNITQIMLVLFLLIDSKTFLFVWNIFQISYIPTVFFSHGNFFPLAFVEIIFCGIFSFYKTKHFNFTYMKARLIFVKLKSI